MTTDGNSEYPTIIGPDAAFKGELTFEKAVRIHGGFEGKVRTKGLLHIADGAKVAADVEAGELRVEGELKGNVTISGKLTLANTARMEGDLRTNRLEMADGAVFSGNVFVGQTAGAGDASRRDGSGATAFRDAPAIPKPRLAPEPASVTVPAMTMPGR